MSEIEDETAGRKECRTTKRQAYRRDQIKYNEAFRRWKEGKLLDQDRPVLNSNLKMLSWRM
jgi:hypothetical protein